jgi:hypothetical protein
VFEVFCYVLGFGIRFFGQCLTLGVRDCYSSLYIIGVESVRFEQDFIEGSVKKKKDMM